MRIKLPWIKRRVSIFDKGMALICLKGERRWCLHLFVYKHHCFQIGFARDDDDYTNQFDVYGGPLFYFCYWWERKDKPEYESL